MAKDDRCRATGAAEMKVGRRRFLSFLGAAPLAAKVAAEGAASQLIGLQGMSIPSAPVMASISGGMPQTIDSGGTYKAKVLRFLAQNSLPDWLEADIRKRNFNVGYLDPDIVSKKSWSLNVKIATQRQRNIERARKDIWDGPRRSLHSRELEEKFGIWI